MELCEIVLQSELNNQFSAHAAVSALKICRRVVPIQAPGQFSQTARVAAGQGHGVAFGIKNDIEASPERFEPKLPMPVGVVGINDNAEKPALSLAKDIQQIPMLIAAHAKLEPGQLVRRAPLAGARQMYNVVCHIEISPSILTIELTLALRKKLILELTFGLTRRGTACRSAGSA